MSDLSTIDPGSTMTPSVETVRYMAPELLNPPGFGLRSSTPTKKSDIYAFGMVAYRVRNACFISVAATKGSAQVITGRQPFPGTKGGVIVYNVITGERPSHPPSPNEWLADDVWNLISGCWSPSRRPGVDHVMNVLNDAADAVEIRRGKLSVTTTKGQGKATSRPVSGASHGHRS